MHLRSFTFALLPLALLVGPSTPVPIKEIVACSLVAILNRAAAARNHDALHSVHSVHSDSTSTSRRTVCGVLRVVRLVCGPAEAHGPVQAV